MCMPVNACHPSVNQENYPSTGLLIEIANVFKTDSDSCKNKTDSDSCKNKTDSDSCKNKTGSDSYKKKTDSDSCITKRNVYNTKLLITLLLRFLR